MKHARLVWFAFALWAASASASLALACDQKTASNASAHSCSAAAAAKCTGAQAAACQAAGMSCPKSASTSASAVTASTAGAASGAVQCPHASGAAAQCPYSNGAQATAVTASTAGAATSGQCSSSASAGSACKGSASSAGTAKTSASHQCEGEGLVKMAEQTLHTNCDGCSDMAHTEQEIMNAGGRVQIVQLKNGVMYMYTAESSAGVRAVQAAVGHRNEHLTAWTTAGDHVHLCDQCKTMRGAAASGKLTREVVNIEGGCLTLVTSTDPGIVAKLHSMAQAAGARSKI
jgi:hypothetical protein